MTDYIFLHPVGPFILKPEEGMSLLSRGLDDEDMRIPEPPLDPPEPDDEDEDDWEDVDEFYEDDEDDDEDEDEDDEEDDEEEEGGDDPKLAPEAWAGGFVENH